MNTPYQLRLFKINTLQIFINIHTYTYSLCNNGIVLLDRTVLWTLSKVRPEVGSCCSCASFSSCSSWIQCSVFTSSLCSLFWSACGSFTVTEGRTRWSWCGCWCGCWCGWRWIEIDFPNRPIRRSKIGTGASGIDDTGAQSNTLIGFQSLHDGEIREIDFHNLPKITRTKIGTGASGIDDTGGP